MKPSVNGDLKWMFFFHSFVAKFQRHMCRFGLKVFSWMPSDLTQSMRPYKIHHLFSLVQVQPVKIL